MTLFEECLAALGDKVTILSANETQKIWECMLAEFPIVTYANVFGRIDWGKVKKNNQISSLEEITSYINANDKIYILWDNASVPSVKTTLDRTLNAIYDIIAIGSNTWIYSPNNGYVIEFYHEGEVTIGWSNDK